jgi:hypothetical protein
VLQSKFAFAPDADRLKFGGPSPVQPDAEGNYPVPGTSKWVEA